MTTQCATAARRSINHAKSAAGGARNSSGRQLMETVWKHPDRLNFAGCAGAISSHRINRRACSAEARRFSFSIESILGGDAGRHGAIADGQSLRMGVGLAAIETVFGARAHSP